MRPISSFISMFVKPQCFYQELPGFPLIADKIQMTRIFVFAFHFA